jgi:hypothetical protein
MWACDALVLGIAAYGLACALVLPPEGKGPSAAIRGRIEGAVGSGAWAVGGMFRGVTECVLCSSFHAGWMIGAAWAAGQWAVGLGQWGQWAVGIVVVPGVACAVAALRAKA